MKLSLHILLICISISQSSEQDYGSRYQTPGPGVLSSANSIYLPPETVTPVPYFPMNQINKLQYPYLPPNPVKLPASFPTPFPPLVMSSTFRTSSQNDYDDDDNDEDDVRPQAAPFTLFENKNNRTEKHTNVIQTQNLDRRILPKTVDYRQPIDRVDVKPELQKPQQFTLNRPIPNTSAKQPQRNVIISPEKRNDQGMDQAKAENYPIPQYLPLPSLFIQSTTETAIPILRLSNEMDLDGSFSYEALGADKTHYVQHSRIENIGNEKPEQVVEGSYSYVGDDGHTYTVHYIADANGFRASGDHLPVPPPVPEIIQRAVQYNLAEEARKPPHLKNWNEEEDTYPDNEKNNYSVLPSHNLFTGRTPESFSFNFLQGGNAHNTLVTAASSQIPPKMFAESISDHLKSKHSSTISPQITFLASQGAHMPSASAPQPTIVKSPTEKATMPQLVNYEANPKEPEQDNKNSLRWQQSANKDNTQSSEKNSISRSFGEDDVMINFNEMTPEQYTNMIHTQIQTQSPIDNSNQANNKYRLSNLVSISQNNANSDSPHTTSTTTETTFSPTKSTYWENYNGINHYNHNAHPAKFQNSKLYQNNQQQMQARAKIITQQNFIPPSQVVTQSYDYIDNSYEIRREKPLNLNAEKVQNTPKPYTLKTIPVYKRQSYENWWNQTYENFGEDHEHKIEVSTDETITAATNNKEVINTIASTNSDDFQPMTIQTAVTQEEPTTENFKDELEENIFLKSVFKSKPKEEIITSSSVVTKSYPEKKSDQLSKYMPKYIHTHTKNMNELHDFNRRPFEVSDIINFISAKNNFESNKLNNNRPSSYNQNEKMYINRNNFNNYYNEETDNSQQQTKREKNTAQELRGVIKNYKVLQRNNGVFNKERSPDQMYRDLTPTSRKDNLPPLGRAGPSVKNYLPALK